MSTHHSRERREQAVPCVRCKKPTFEFDRCCELCTEAKLAAAVDEAYYQFDLDVNRVEVPEFRLDPQAVLSEILAGLE